jgi:adenylate cyclase
LANELDVAVALIDRAVEANPNLALAWAYRGWINVLLGHPEHAIDYFERGLRLSPLDPTAFVSLSGLAYASLFSDQYVEAVRWAAKAVIAKHDFLPAQRIAMVSHALSGDIQAAKASWKVVRQLDPTQRISQTRDRLPLRREADYAKLIQAYRLVGMPE